MLAVPLLAFTPTTDATTTISTGPITNIPDSGRDPTMDVLDSTIAILHKTSANALVLTFSLNNGSTWADRAVTGPITNLNATAIIVLSPTSFVIYYTLSTGDLVSFRSTDSGFTWVGVSTSSYMPLIYDCAVGLAVAANANRSVIVVVGANPSPTCGSNAGRVVAYTSTDYGLTYGPQHSIVGAGAGTTNPLVEILFTSYGNFSVYSDSVGPTRVDVVNNATGTGYAIADAYVPAAFTGPRGVIPQSDLGVFMRNTTTNAITLVQRVGATTFQSFNSGSALTKIQGFATSGRIGFVGYQDSSNSLVLTCTNIAGTPSWATSTLYGPGNNTEIGLVVHDDELLIAFNNGVTLGFLRNDDMTCTSSGGASDAAGFWCSAPGDPDFGFDFLEDVTRDTSDVLISIDPYYKFEGDSGDYGYLGKSFGGVSASGGTGSMDMKSYFRIEALSEGADSNFRSSFVFTPATGTNVTPIMDKGTGSTAGDSSGDFSKHIEARWLETADDWNIRFFYVDEGSGITERTSFGAAAVVDNPNSPNSYVFHLNTTAGTATVTRFNGDVILSATLPSNFTGEEMFGHYFVGFHTGTFIGDEHRMALDEDADTDLSTCIEDLDAASGFNGGTGRDPDSLDLEEPEEPVDDDPTGEDADPVNVLGVQSQPPTGFTTSAWSFLIGIIFMAAIAGGFYFINQRPLMAGIGGGVGFMGAFAFGLFPLWAVLLVALAAAAIVVLKFKQG